MTASMFAVRRFSLDDLIRSDEFDRFRADRLGNDLFIDDPERADRIHKAAEFGADGSFHAEVIEDWRVFLSCCCSDLPVRVRDKIYREIDACEDWHNRNGSLWTEVG